VEDNHASRENQQISILPQLGNSLKIITMVALGSVAGASVIDFLGSDAADRNERWDTQAALRRLPAFVKSATGDAWSMSACERITDSSRTSRHVRFVPRTDMPLFDNLVGTGQQRSWNLDAKPLRCLEVDE
jgi:hypothetical protein